MGKARRGSKARQRQGRVPGAPAWQPLEPGQPVISPAMAAAAAADPAVAGIIAENSEMWLNDKYVVIVERNEDRQVKVLSIRRADRKPARDWRDFQRIKNQLAGEHTEAVELYPDEDRLLDTSNQYHLWCMPPGVRFPLGYTERAVLDRGEGPDVGAVQRPF
jgi:hypothetical protein